MPKSFHVHVRINDIPEYLWFAVKVRAAQERKTIREWMIKLLQKEIGRERE